MTLDQYLVTVAWLFIAFLMWFSVTRAKYVFSSDDMDVYLLLKSANMDCKLEWDNFCILMYIFAPTVLYTFCWSMFLLPLLLT